MVRLEMTGSLPDRAGVDALVTALREAPGDLTLSLGRVCGGRVSVVWLGESLELRSLTLEAHELDDADAARVRVCTFLEELKNLPVSEERR